MLKKYVSAIVFWGALWGLEEATLGHLLHITTFNIGWFLWFPLAYFFMGMVFKQTGKMNSILFTSMVAAAIKLVNLFMTAQLIIVICPTLSIILEGISLFAVLRLFDWKKYLCKHKFIEIVSVSLLWRILYLVCLLAIPSWIMSAYPYKGTVALLKFFLYEGIINGIFIYGIKMSVIKIKGMNDEKNAHFKLLTDKLIELGINGNVSFKPLVAFSLLAIALIIQCVL